MDLLRQQFLDERCGQSQAKGCDSVGEGHDGRWGCGFAPRESRERVRNCSQVDHDVSQHIADTIARFLLRTECLVSTEGCGHEEGPSQSGMEPKKWNMGGEDYCQTTTPLTVSLSVQEDFTLVKQSRCSTRKC